jgi:trehalose 6-phosphate phosphatase
MMRADPAASAVFADFDGTLAEIVAEPRRARPVRGIADTLQALAGSYRCVGVLSGRPVGFMSRFFGDDVLLAGLYGLELRHRGRSYDHPLGGVWREVVDDVASCASARGPAGMGVESKGLSLTLHYRGDPSLARAVRSWAEEQAARSGLVMRPARMSVELHPPIRADKGTTILDHVADVGAVLFVGDDEGDLPAFDALDLLEDKGVGVCRVGVRSEEAAPELMARADVVVDGPAGVAGLLRDLQPLPPV